MQDKNCNKCGIKFNISDEDLSFYEKVSPVFGGKKCIIPTPCLCHDCRRQRRLSFGNQTKLYTRECSATGKHVISIYSPDKPYNVYDYKYWWSDKWDAMDYGIEYDFSRSFFEQFNDIFKQVPQMNLYVDGNENSDYVNWTGWAKSCYLCFSSDNSENSYYCHDAYYSNNCVDCSYCYSLTKCYNCVDCKDSFKLFFSQNCENANSSYFLYDCNGVENCFGCFGLRNKKYFIFNKEYSKEEYENIVSEYKELISRNDKEFINKIQTHLLSFPKKSYIGNNNENSNGDFIFNCKNAIESFDNIDLEDSKYCCNIKGGKDCYDFDRWGHFSEKAYECFGVGQNTINTLFCSCVWGGSTNLIYSMFCVNNCSNLFGCVGLKNKEYCILNKQYTKEEYNELVPKIIDKMKEDKQWGEFFPSDISQFGYNETVSEEYYPLTKSEALKQGFIWSDYVPPKLEVNKTISANKLPKKIIDIPDDILNWSIECEVSNKPFRIIKSELDFYRKHDIPIPRRHPDERHLDRMKLRNPRKLFDRQCDKCNKDMKTTYSKDRNEKVYCEDCYNKEIY